MNNNGFTVINNNIMDNTNISDGAYRLYSVLLSMCYGDKDSCYPSQEYLSKRLNKSVRTIQRYLTELEESKLIKKKRRGSTSNLYTIISKALNKVVDKVTNIAKNIIKKNNTKNNYTKKNLFDNYPQNTKDNYFKGLSLEDLESKLLGWEK